MSQALREKLAELGTKEDQVLDILRTDSATVATLQAALDARREAGDDSDGVALAQALIDKLDAALTPTPAGAGALAQAAALPGVMDQPHSVNPGLPAGVTDQSSGDPPAGAAVQAAADDASQSAGTADDPTRPGQKAPGAAALDSPTGGGS